MQLTHAAAHHDGQHSNPHRARAIPTNGHTPPMTEELNATVALVTGASSGIAYIVSRPRHVAVNELLIHPTEQEG